MWFVQDFEGTLSVKSTARDESPGPGKVSPLDRLEDERKKKADMLAAAADKCVPDFFSCLLPAKGRKGCLYGSGCGS